MSVKRKIKEANPDGNFDSYSGLKIKQETESGDTEEYDISSELILNNDLIKVEIDLQEEENIEFSEEKLVNYTFFDNCEIKQEKSPEDLLKSGIDHPETLPVSFQQDINQENTKAKHVLKLKDGLKMQTCENCKEVCLGACGGYVKMEWSNDMILEFLHQYEAEPVIWDPRNMNHKRKHLVADAWRRLISKLSFGESTNIEELKKKKDSLMAYYRIHLNKMKNTTKSGMGTDDTYKTSWFAFPVMNNFLAPIYQCSRIINTQEPLEKADISDESSSSIQRNQPLDSMSVKKKRQHDIPDLLQAKKQMNEAYSTIKERATLKKTERVHECDLYAKLLAEKLKKLDEERRTILMHNIDNLVFQEIMSARVVRRRRERATSEASSYSSSQSNCDTVLNSPKSPLITHPSSPNSQSVSTQTVGSSLSEIVFSQSQQPSLQPVHLSPEIQSLSDNSISMQSQQT